LSLTFGNTQQMLLHKLIKYQQTSVYLLGAWSTGIHFTNEGRFFSGY